MKGIDVTLNIQKESLKDKIASILMQRIINGEIDVGEKLREAHLAKEFGVSQAPVREAIIALVSLGILEHKVNVGARVRAFDKSETIEIYQARDALEQYAISHIKDFNKVEVLKSHYQEMLEAAKAKDTKQFIVHDQHFHETLLLMSGNKLLLELWRQQYTKSSVQNVIKNFEASLENIVKIHLPIIEAIEVASVTQSQETVAVHYETIIQSIKDDI
ncbi:GntR family transcriptional regulator [Sulfurovum sp. CS9]|uniref:GntR family transcriptional regulator n=1 Tax=Sulfurovum sp. CS9 TaxID=3391146 RepID=UPI0039E9B823